MTADLSIFTSDCKELNCSFTINSIMEGAHSKIIFFGGGGMSEIFLDYNDFEQFILKEIDVVDEQFDIFSSWLICNLIKTLEL